MRTYEVQLTATAERHVRIVGAWWEANRPDTAGLFQAELADAVAQLADSPHRGRPYAASRLAAARRILLGKTGYHVYYTVDDDRAVVTVRAVWHAARGRAPRLS